MDADRLAYRLEPGDEPAHAALPQRRATPTASAMARAAASAVGGVADGAADDEPVGAVARSPARAWRRASDRPRRGAGGTDAGRDEDGVRAERARGATRPRRASRRTSGRPRRRRGARGRDRALRAGAPAMPMSREIVVVERGEDGDRADRERAALVRGARDRAPQHRAPAAGVHRDDARAEARRLRDRALDRLGDVVELQIEEDGEPELACRARRPAGPACTKSSSPTLSMPIDGATAPPPRAPRRRRRSRARTRWAGRCGHEAADPSIGMHAGTGGSAPPGLRAYVASRRRRSERHLGGPGDAVGEGLLQDARGDLEAHLAELVDRRVEEPGAAWCCCVYSASAYEAPRTMPSVISGGIGEDGAEAEAREHVGVVPWPIGTSRSPTAPARKGCPSRRARGLRSTRGCRRARPRTTWWGWRARTRWAARRWPRPRGPPPR